VDKYGNARRKMQASNVVSIDYKIKVLNLKNKGRSWQNPPVWHDGYFFNTTVFINLQFNEAITDKGIIGKRSHSKIFIFTIPEVLFSIDKFIHKIIFY
jgi:hypothetical protein